MPASAARRRAGIRYVAVVVMLTGSVAAARAEPVPVVLDAYGRAVAPLIAPGSVAMTIQGRVYRIAFSENGFVVDAPRMRNYECTDCSGTAYLEASLSLPIAYVGTNPQASCTPVFGPGHRAESSACADDEKRRFSPHPVLGSRLRGAVQGAVAIGASDAHQSVRAARRQREGAIQT